MDDALEISEQTEISGAFGESGAVAPYVSQRPVSVSAVTRAVELDRPQPV